MYVCVCVCVCAWEQPWRNGKQSRPRALTKACARLGGDVNTCEQLPKPVLAWGHQLRNHSLRLYEGLLKLIKAVLRLY